MRFAVRLPGGPAGELRLEADTVEDAWVHAEWWAEDYDWPANVIAVEILLVLLDSADQPMGDAERGRLLVGTWDSPTAVQGEVFPLAAIAGEGDRFRFES